MEDFSWTTICKILWNKIFGKKPSITQTQRDCGIITGNIEGGLQQQNNNSKQWNFAIYQKDITQNITHIIQKEMSIPVTIDDENREKLFEITLKYVKSQKEMQKFLKKVVQYCEEYGYKSIPLKTIKILEEMDDDDLVMMKAQWKTLKITTPPSDEWLNIIRLMNIGLLYERGAFYDYICLPTEHYIKLMEIDQKYPD